MERKTKISAEDGKQEIVVTRCPFSFSRWRWRQRTFWPRIITGPDWVIVAFQAGGPKDCFNWTINEQQEP